MKNIKDMKKILLIVALFMAGAVNAQNEHKIRMNLANKPIEKKELILWLQGDTSQLQNWNISPEQFVQAFREYMESTSYGSYEFGDAKDIAKFIKRKTKVVQYKSSEETYIISQYDIRCHCIDYISGRIDPGNILYIKIVGGYYVPLRSLQTAKSLH